MSCNCNRNGNSCGVPKQPNYNNLNKGFVVPKKDCCDCGDEDKICRNGKVVIIDKNHLYPHEGIYLEDKDDGNQILHITLRPNDYTYIVNFKDGDNFYITHIFITYKEDNSNNCNNIYKLYINNQRDCHPIEIRIDDNLKQFNNFYVRELDDYINDPNTFKYLKGKFFKLRSMRNLEIEVSKPMNNIRMYCDDNILKNNLRHSNVYIIDSDKIIEDEDDNKIINININLNTFDKIIIDDFCDIVYINFNGQNCDNINYEYKFMIIDNYGTGAQYVFDRDIIWANDEVPDFFDSSLYEINISLCGGIWHGVYAKYDWGF